MVEELFLDCVLAETGDRAQAAGHGGAGASLSLQLSGEHLDVGPADREQRVTGRGTSR
jgi:hypothetical protein